MRRHAASDELTRGKRCTRPRARLRGRRGLAGGPKCEYDPRRRCPWVLDGAEPLPLNTSMSERCARSARESARESTHQDVCSTRLHTPHTRSAVCRRITPQRAPESARESAHQDACSTRLHTPQTRHATHGVPRARSASGELPGDLGECPAHQHHNLKQTVPHCNSATDTVSLHSNSTVSSGRVRSPAISAISPRHHSSSWMVQHHNECGARRACGPNKNYNPSRPHARLAPPCRASWRGSALAELVRGLRDGPAPPGPPAPAPRPLNMPYNAPC